MYGGGQLLPLPPYHQGIPGELHQKAQRMGPPLATAITGRTAQEGPKTGEPQRRSKAPWDAQVGLLV